MSVVINMKMQENCKKCDFSIFAGSSYWCSQCGEWCLDADKRLDNCPILTELPEKHGRLIDADELIEFIENRYTITWESDCYEGGIKDACTDIIEKINSMPTIIEAEGGK